MKINYIKSAHDVSLGGIITAISKMCIKGNKGINLKKPKFLINEIEYFFGEDQGRYIIEINQKNLKKSNWIYLKKMLFILMKLERLMKISYILTIRQKLQLTN